MYLDNNESISTSIEQERYVFLLFLSIHQYKIRASAYYQYTPWHLLKLDQTHNTSVLQSQWALKLLPLIYESDK